MAEPLGTQRSYFVEERAIFISLSFLKKLNYKKIVLVEDSLNIINILKGTYPSRWTIKGMIKDALEKLNNL